MEEPLDQGLITHNYRFIKEIICEFLYRFSRAERIIVKTKFDAPGPGEYSITPTKEGPSYSFRPKTSLRVNDAVPGPGNYDPKGDAVKDKSPMWIIGREEKGNRNKLAEAVPGPGTYFSTSTLNGPKWGFGSGKRGQKNMEAVPGPGTYEIKSTVGAVPSYVQS